jgi:hypothetical protein|nr:MAG TPA: Nuclease [Caudoviricetes sp.]
MASERQHQQAVMKWARQPSIRDRWPELALLHHIKNETTGGAAEVAADKAMGVKKGVPDLCLPVTRGGFHGLYIEMKTPSGRASDAQRWWMMELTKQGYRAVVCHGYDAAVAELCWYLSLPKEVR